ncbi:MAG: TonB-dependent receptor [Acidobacteriaceae bacterium]|nr:TonB-dependent receptor [Acidobacteriaceae bacterium]MBV9296494.1 TonB-dependent receptor [Acidobacteriaceae bacterium]
MRIKSRNIFKTFTNVVLAAVLMTSSVLVLPVFAQLTSGNITGTLYDPAGATVPNATIVAMNNATGVENTTTSTGAGDYRFENLPIGTYRLTVNASGFAKAQIANVVVQLNQTVTTNVTLQIGQTSSVVEVTAAPPNIDTTTAQLQTTFETKQMADLPSASGGQAGSGVLNLSLLAPGVTSSGGLGYGMGPSVGGQRPTNNNFTIEGVDNNSLAVTGALVLVPNDAVAEFSILQNQFSPDFGHSSGGQFNQVVKSGTNEFHGTLYEYFENRNLNAADNLNYVEGNPLHPRFDNNRFGGNFGGPIKRNKLFFFLDYEYQPIGTTASTFYYAPTAAGYSTLAALPGINANNLTQFQKYLGTATTTNGPAVLVAPGPGSVEFLGTGVFAPGGTGALSIPTGQLSFALPNYTNNEAGVGSIDYTISDKDSLRGRLILNRTGTIDTSGFPSVFFGVVPTNAYIATLSEYHTFTPTLINEFRAGYNRSLSRLPVFGNQTFPGLDSFPNIDVYELQAAFGPDSSAPQYTIQNLYQVTDNLTWTKGDHSFKFGFDGWNAISPSSFTQRARGDYEWSFLSDYLYDYAPDGIAERSTGHFTYYQNQQLFGFYGNDNWKLRPNLTVNLGLRWEYLTIPVGEQTQNLNASASAPGLIVFNNPKTQKNNFMPRVGIAYSPGTSGKTSIRAGFGLTYDIIYDNLGTLSLPPQLTSTIDATPGNPNFLGGGGIPANASATIPEGAAARAATSGFVPDQKRPEAINWNFGIQHAFGNYTFETRYVGTRGLFLPVQTRINIQPVVNASNALPVFFTAPSQATLNALPNQLAPLPNGPACPNCLETIFDNGGFIVPAYANAGFTSPITAFMPVGNSIYHGWSNQLTRRFSNGLQFQGSYTWSHNIDDSTAAVNTTVLAPRRPEDFQDLAMDRASSILDHRNRIVLQMIYDVPFYKNSNWFLKNIVGNWEIAPVYIYQTGQLATPQSAVDANLNNDSAPDRVFINPNGTPGLSTGVTALTNSAGYTVGYLANNPNAMYVAAGRGTLPDGGRNLVHLNPTDDIDVSLLKRFNITERFRLEFSARVFNIFNHPQYVGGYLNDVAAFAYAFGTAGGDLARTTIIPGNPNFGQWSQAFSSNPRQMQLALKLIF